MSDQSGQLESETIAPAEGRPGLKRAWYDTGGKLLELELAPDGHVVVARHWNRLGRPVTTEELQRRDAAANRALAAALEVLEVPLTVVLSGLK